ncbi:hypothetical protein EDC94DRAFT_596942 [Helicostylum pulchrum]|nr:hypothetical protein EDC94DRAFT_596942 [Helicostylum pulchrum]
MTKALTGIQDLPIDILIQIINYFEARELLELSTCWKFISSSSLQKLWHSPKCHSIAQLTSLLSTLGKKKSDCMYPYHTWISEMCISGEIMQTVIPREIIHNVQHVELKVKRLQLCNVHTDQTGSEMLSRLLITDRIKEISIENCSVEIISCLSKQITTTTTINRISIKDNFITDPWIKDIVAFTPKLTHFSSQRSGYVSDIAILAITQNCPLIESLIVTLPNHIIQSNTITFRSIQSLQNCIHLKKFVCRGQVRISNQESQDWLYAHCPQLQHCDLSF